MEGRGCARVRTPDGFSLFVHRTSRIARRASHVGSGIGSGIGIGGEGGGSWRVYDWRGGAYRSWRGLKVGPGPPYVGSGPTVRRTNGDHTSDRRSPYVGRTGTIRRTNGHHPSDQRAPYVGPTVTIGRDNGHQTSEQRAPSVGPTDTIRRSQAHPTLVPRMGVRIVGWAWAHLQWLSRAFGSERSFGVALVGVVRLAWKEGGCVEGSEGGPRPTLRRIQAHHTLDRRSP